MERKWVSQQFHAVQPPEGMAPRGQRRGESDILGLPLSRPHCSLRLDWESGCWLLGVEEEDVGRVGGRILGLVPVGLQEIGLGVPRGPGAGQEGTRGPWSTVIRQSFLRAGQWLLRRPGHFCPNHHWVFRRA